MDKKFSSSTWPAISQVAKAIVAAVAPERIYVLSVIHQHRSVDSIYACQPVEEQVVEAIHLLILVHETGKPDNNDLQDMIEYRLKLPMVVSTTLLFVEQFNQWLKEGHPFSFMVYTDSFLYYDAGNFPFAAPELFDPIAWQQLASKEVLHKISRAGEFLSGAELFMIRKQHEMAVFHLHQATEQMLCGLIRYRTGYRTQTHNLDKLYRLAMYLLPALKKLFPRITEEEKNLFKILQAAYFGARYNSDYVVKRAIVAELFDKVRELLLSLELFVGGKKISGSMKSFSNPVVDSGF